MTDLFLFWIINFFILFLCNINFLNRSLTAVIISFTVFFFSFFLQNLPDQNFFEQLYYNSYIGDIAYPKFNMEGDSGLETGFLTLYILLSNFFTYKISNAFISAIIAWNILYITSLLVEKKYFSSVSIVLISIYFLNYVFISQRFGLVIMLNMMLIFFLIKKKYFSGFVVATIAHLFHFFGIFLIPLYFFYLAIHKLNIFASAVTVILIFCISLFVYANIIDISGINIPWGNNFIKTTYLASNSDQPNISNFFMLFFFSILFLGLNSVRLSKLLKLSSPFIGIMLLFMILIFIKADGTILGRLSALLSIVPLIFALQNIAHFFSRFKINYLMFSAFSLIFYYHVIKNKDYMYLFFFE